MKKPKKISTIFIQNPRRGGDEVLFWIKNICRLRYDGAELGHTKLAYHGSSCTCRQLGCAEAYCSATALIRQAKEELTKETADRMKGSVMYELYGNDLDRLDAKMVVDAYKMGDRIAKKEKNIMKKPEKKAADMTVKELASYIDYSVLKPEFTEEEIIDLTKDGVKL